jgi:hypothetical protein
MAAVQPEPWFWALITKKLSKHLTKQTQGGGNG